MTVKVILYARCSTADQAKDGVSIDVQRDVLTREAAHRGWDAMWLADEGVSGKTTERQKLQAALALLAAGEAQALVATRVDRISRHVGDFADLLRRAQREDWNVVVLDIGLDLRSPFGKAAVQMAAVFAELERDLISDRTKAALAVKRAQGVRLGRPRSTPLDVVERVVGERMGGATLTAIAEGLNRDAIPTAAGGKRWLPGTVRALLVREGVC